MIHAFFRANRRPALLSVIAAACLVAHHVLVRAAVHGHTSHQLLAAGAHAPPGGAVGIAVALLVVRCATVIIVPGLLLAAAAEVIAYVLVGPKRPDEEGG